MKHISRRDFLRRASALSAIGAVSPLAMNLAGIGNAVAATASDYKALICVYLTGGNDAYNTVLATDSASWDAYAQVRCQDSDPIGLRAAGTAAVHNSSAPFSDQLGGVLPIAPIHSQGRSFALHPSMSGVRDLFDSRRLAVVSNVGPLLRSTTKAEYDARTAQLPPRLFSHNDQQSVWQSLSSEGATAGWGGRLVEPYLSDNGGSMFSSITLQGAALWVNGTALAPYQMAMTGPIRIGDDDGLLYGSAVAQAKLEAIMRTSRSTHVMAVDHAAVVVRSNEAEKILRDALPAVADGPWGTPGVAPGDIDPLLAYTNPDSGLVEENSLAAEMQTVLRTIEARGALGIKRQVFFVNLDGFDTHNEHARKHASLVARLSHALAYLDNTLRAMGMADNVTAFTASDFGRGFACNGDGTDHGWGGHHLVLGGAVKGGDLYGTFPTYGVGDSLGVYNSPDQLANGVLLPRVSVDQYGATLAQWFGQSANDSLAMFPNLKNFDSSVRNLGFMA
jgi:uncharacterized protein (DUF1501 family)